MILNLTTLYYRRLRYYVNQVYIIIIAIDQMEHSIYKKIQDLQCITVLD